MRFMVMVKANKDSEAGVLPDDKLTPELREQEERIGKQMAANARR